MTEVYRVPVYNKGKIVARVEYNNNSYIVDNAQIEEGAGPSPVSAHAGAAGEVLATA